MWHAGLLRGLPDASRDFVYDYIVMRRVAANQAAETDDCVVLARFGQGAGSGRNFKRTGNADNCDVIFTRS